jgi:SIR2-like domain
VTTNFDDHFSTAAVEVFAGEPPEMFAAPALPVGSNFSGIVHIHGSVTKSPTRLVLIDQDFGRAYLTEGWARRFIQDVFLNYVVLFVGYSHNDPVMHHLARGLPPVASSNRRFVLTPEDKHDSWNNLGITDLVYPLRPGNDHSALQIAVSAWGARLLRLRLRPKNASEGSLAGLLNRPEKT